MALKHSFGNLWGSCPKALGDIREPGTGLVFSRDQGDTASLPRGTGRVRKLRDAEASLCMFSIPRVT